MGVIDFIGTALGLLLMMTGFATSGFMSGRLGTLSAVAFISVGFLFFLWGETR
ncbi:hypothetical protein GS429_00575 [Natronorubrum sp. JWXQ-INN-674]|uniref:Uncharacterized protein n=1 Tax=Natronorubrum halalkaliphilum TaxID=2691917 RepID=A0A6B0VHN4_9EURY|nr:hypothetical protein [Natronorubrum halalkaliphilum]MXV60587.1 hypothetical protein [Natronorubrum halalkaliphilum]